MIDDDDDDDDDGKVCIIKLWKWPSIHKERDNSILKIK